MQGESLPTQGLAGGARWAGCPASLQGCQCWISCHWQDCLHVEDGKTKAQRVTMAGLISCCFFFLLSSLFQCPGARGRGGNYTFQRKPSFCPQAANKSENSNLRVRHGTSAPSHTAPWSSCGSWAEEALGLGTGTTVPDHRAPTDLDLVCVLFLLVVPNDLRVSTEQSRAGWARCGSPRDSGLGAHTQAEQRSVC